MQLQGPTSNENLLQGVNALVAALNRSGYFAGRYRGRMTPAAFAVLPDVQDLDVVDLVVDATNGIVWRVLYNAGSASASKWEFVGGGALAAEVLTDESTVSTTYVDLTTVGPSVTVPRDGDYLVSFGAELYNVTAGNLAIVAVKRGAAATSDNDFVLITSATASAAGSPARTIPVAGLTASAVLKLQYRGNGGTAHAARRWIAVTPVRVT